LQDIIITTQRFYRQLIASLKIIANFSNVSNLRKDHVVSGATDEKYFICLWRAEKKAKAQMKFNSQGMLGKGGGGRYGGQLPYLGYLLGIAVGLFDGLGQYGQASIGSPSRGHIGGNPPSVLQCSVIH